MTSKICRFLNEQHPSSPCLVVDLDVIAENYDKLRTYLPVADIYYAVKANPAREVVAHLISLGSNFDVASPAEIDLCLSCGVRPASISYGNTIKKQGDIAYAYERGIRLFAFDSEAEVQKLAAAAPGSQVFCRILVDNAGAEWPLSRKFGCDVEMAVDLLKFARKMGLDPYGVAFHVGSQQTDLTQWDVAVGKTAMLFTALNEAGIELKLVNLGGGFPAQYRSEVDGLEVYCAAVMNAMTKHFRNNLPTMILEPGRSLVGDSGVLQAEVVLISRKSYQEETRWIYLDVGRFGGLAETENECIKYRIVTPDVDGAMGPVILAGPTCDSADILYERAGYEMPLDLKIGDRVHILSTGAYTASYSSVNFNGFAPLRSYFI
ncbi:MAG: ornithine decarboxylase [Rhodospirillaceae bacterium]|nr:MAG: ornithine decarboxylase [Rhodospirillaceae bacterium]